MAKENYDSQNKSDEGDQSTRHESPQIVGLTIKQICRAGNYSRAHLNKQIASGSLPSYLVGRCRRVLLSDYLAYLERLKEENQRSLTERGR
jgi:hypothetical protein